MFHISAQVFDANAFNSKAEAAAQRSFRSVWRIFGSLYRSFNYYNLRIYWSFIQVTFFLLEKMQENQSHIKCLKSLGMINYLSLLTASKFKANRKSKFWHLAVLKLLNVKSIKTVKMQFESKVSIFTQTNVIFNTLDINWYYRP